MQLCAKSTLFLLAIPLTVNAQDRRTVTEPKIPPSCTVVRASLASHAGKLGAKDESLLDTARLQRALNACQQGRAVELALGPDGNQNAFLTGPLSLPTGVTLLIDRGVTLMASRDPRLYDIHPGSCGLVNQQPEGCRAVISVAHAPHSAIMGDGVIDGRGGETLLNDPVAKDQAPTDQAVKITWWDLANQARAGGRQQVPRLIVADNSDDFTLYRITLRNSPNFHVLYRGGLGFTVWNLKIDTPRTARNTDGVDPAGSQDITVTHSFIRTGDDNIAIKGGDSAAAPGGGVAYMTVRDNHFFYGHGMSIGSETVGGVHHILVENLSLDGPDNGIRIKSNPSRGGLVDHVKYTHVCIRDSRRPIVLDTHYNNPGPRTDLYPQFRNITLENVHIFGGGQIGLEGLDARHKSSLTLNGVLLDDPSRYTLHATHADIHYGPQPVNFKLTGEDVTSSGTPDSTLIPSPVAACSAMFVPFEESEK